MSPATTSTAGLRTDRARAESRARTRTALRRASSNRAIRSPVPRVPPITRIGSVEIMAPVEMSVRRPSCGLEEREIDEFSKRHVPGGVRVQVVAARVRRLQGRAAVITGPDAHQSIEIHDRVECRLGTYPRIDGESLRLHRGCPSDQVRSCEGKQRPADDGQALSVSAIDDLLNGGGDLWRVRAAANVVHALKIEHVRDAAAIEHVTIEALERRRAVAATENDPVARDPRIDNR